MEQPNSAKKRQRRSLGFGSRSGSCSSSSGGGFGGFCTAWEAKDTLAAAAAAAKAEAGKEKEKENRNGQKQLGVGGNGNDDADNGGGKPLPNAMDGETEPVPAVDLPDADASADLPLSHPVSLSLTLRGTKFHRDDIGKKLLAAVLRKGSIGLILEREPNNEYDEKAIAVRCRLAADDADDTKTDESEENDEEEENENTGGHDGDGKSNNTENAQNEMEEEQQNQQQQLALLKTIGHVAKEQAAVLSPYLDAGWLRLGDSGGTETAGPSTGAGSSGTGNGPDSSSLVTVMGKHPANPSWHRLRVTGVAKAVPSMLEALDDPALFGNVVDVDSFLAKGLAKVRCFVFGILPAVLLLYCEFGIPAKSYYIFLTVPDDILARLGMGPKDDAAWWSNIAGLKPPAEWNVTGPHDVMEKLAIFKRHQRDGANAILDGAIHGVTDVWTDDMLDDMRDAMHSKDFWCYRGQDAFIRSFGGPYVLVSAYICCLYLLCFFYKLAYCTAASNTKMPACFPQRYIFPPSQGQKSGDLKLIQGTPHTDLTAKICKGHNLVYAATHLKHPLGPKGFNVIVFGLNIRRGGFHFHKDHKEGFLPKSAPLLDEQPVATTVFYERPDFDDGKEVVNWKPASNFDGIQAKGGTAHDQEERGTRKNNYYLSARTVRTYHGMVHIQRAGLQKEALHGIFHAPGDEDERKGYRVAITARVAYPDAEERIAPFIEKGDYCRTIGPNGQDQLPSSTV